MSINAKPKPSLLNRYENSSFSKNLIKSNSIHLNSLKNRNLTDNKNTQNSKISLSSSRNNIFSRQKSSILAKREAEYDKNLKRIKSNLLDKFNNYSLLRDNDRFSKENPANNFSDIENGKSFKRKLNRERSRYNIKKYSPSVKDSKKFPYLDHENCDKENFSKFTELNEGCVNKENLINFTSLRMDDKENLVDNHSYSENFQNSNSDSKKKIQKRFQKKILLEKNNIFSLENEINSKSDTRKIITKPCIEIDTGKGTRIYSNISIFDDSEKKNLNAKKNIFFNKKTAENIIFSNTTKNTKKKFLLNLKEKKNSVKNCVKKESPEFYKNINEKIQKNFIEKISENNKKEENFPLKENVNIDIQMLTEISFSNCNENILTDNCLDNLIHDQFEEYTNDSATTEHIDKNFGNLGNLFHSKENSNLKKKTHMKKNSELEIIQENESFCFQKIFQSEKIINNFPTTENSCNILESGGLSKKFSQMKKNLNLNLNNIQNDINKNSEFSDFSTQNIYNQNTNTDKFYASSLINSIDSIKNFKQNLNIFSNNNQQNIPASQLSNNINSLQNSNNFNNNLNFSNSFKDTNSNFGNFPNLNSQKINFEKNNNSDFILNNNHTTPDIYTGNFTNFSQQQQNTQNFLNNQKKNYLNYNSKKNSTNNLNYSINSNNFDKKFNNLQINSCNNYTLPIKGDNNTDINNPFKNSNYSTNNPQNNINFNNNISLSNQYKNFTNKINKIDLNFNKEIIYKNEPLQNEINSIEFSVISYKNNTGFINNIPPLYQQGNNRSDSKVNNFTNFIFAEKFIFFTTEQYRNLLNSFLNIEYGKEILKNFFFEEKKNLTKNILNNHNITERMRTKMVDWIIEVTENYRCDQTTFFLTVSILDRFLDFTDVSFTPDDLLNIGVSSLFIASKFSDVFPIKLSSASEKISHSKLSKELIKKFEEKILKTLNYEILIPTAFDFINFYIEEIFNITENNYNIKNEVLREYLKVHEEKKEINFDKDFYEKFTKTKDFDSKMLEILRKVVIYLSKMNCYDINLISLKPSLLGAATLILGVKITEQVMKVNLINDYLISEIPRVAECLIGEIFEIAEKILKNAKNFEVVFPGLENLKKFHFDFFGN